MIDEIARHTGEVQEAIARLPAELLEQVQQALLSCHRSGGTIFICGNGGSAATASHFACDLTKGTRHENSPRLRVVALTDNIPLMTAWGNDNGYDCIFAEQLAPLVRRGDLLLVISGSGNSPNVVNALKAARDAGAYAVALTGSSGGRAAQEADLTVRVPAEHIEAVEDAHSIMCHALTVAIRQSLRQQAAS